MSIFQKVKEIPWKVVARDLRDAPPRPSAIGPMFTDSLREMRVLRQLVLIALLTALQIVIDMVTGLYITKEIKMTFGFTCMAVTGMLFGPTMAALQGAIADIFVALFFPKGAYFAGYTLSAVIGGMIYGVFFYKRGITWARALFAKGLINLLVNIGLNTVWLSITGGKAMTLLLPARILKNAVLLPIEVLVLVLVAQAVRRIPKRLISGR